MFTYVQNGRTSFLLSPILTTPFTMLDVFAALKQPPLPGKQEFYIPGDKCVFDPWASIHLCPVSEHLS